jgi:hypothetical protein
MPCARQDLFAQAIEALTSSQVFFSVGTVSDWDGGVWERSFLGAQAYGVGHTVKLIAPQFVKPYVRANKNDAAQSPGSVLSRLSVSMSRRLPCIGALGWVESS